MTVQELVPCPSQRTLFHLRDLKFVPSKAGCYVITSFEDAILYIGLSDNLRNRFQQHLDNPEKTAPTNEGKPTWFYYLIYNEKEVEKLERTWHNQFVSVHGRLPILNKIQSPVG